MARPALSVQLYSVRDLLAEDPAGTLAALASTGFTAVEPFDLAEWADRLAAPLADAGLAAPTAHASLVGADVAAALTVARRLGVGTLIEPAVDADRWTTREGVDAVARALNEAAERGADHGIAVGYHNHWWELESLIDGAPALEVLADRLDDRVRLEVDAYWAAVGGVDPVELLRRLGDRVVAIHVKDGPVSRDTKAQVPAGGGGMPLRDVIAAAPAARLVVEFDDYAGDVLEGVAAARSWIIGEGLDA